MIDLRPGRWQDALAGVDHIDHVDAMITDPPFSERVHTGHNAALPGDRRGIDYDCLSESDINVFVGTWKHRVAGWWAILTDHLSAALWADELARCGLYVFAPLPCVDPGSRVRLQGDGPSSWTTWLIVARPRTREYSTWGTLPGAYVRGCKRERLVRVGGKPIWLMRAIVRDYSRPGDLVCDPFAGAGTTLLAAAIEGRSAIGSEIDEEAHTAAQERLSRPYTQSMFGAEAP